MPPYASYATLTPILVDKITRFNAATKLGSLNSLHSWINVITLENESNDPLSYPISHEPLGLSLQK